MTSAFAGGALVLLLAGAGFGARARRAAPVSRACASSRRAPERSPDKPGPGPVPPAGPALARPRGDEADREPRPGRAPDAADRPGHRAGDDPARTTRATTSATSTGTRPRACSEPHVRVHVGERALTTWLRARRVRLDGVRHRRPPQGRRRRGRRAGRRPRRDAARQPARRARLRRRRAARSCARARAASACSRCWRSCAARRRRRRRRDVARRGAEQRRGARPPARARRDRLRLPRRSATGRRRCSALRARHGVMAVEIVDPREQELVPAGDLWLVDPETGRQVHVDTRRSARSASASPRPRPPSATRSARRCAARAPTTSCSPPRGDWLRIFAGHLRRGEAALRAGAPAPRRRRATGCAAGAQRELRRADPARRLHPDPARDARLRVAAAAPPARVRGVGEPRARPEPRRPPGRAGAATCRRCCCCSRWPR